MVGRRGVALALTANLLLLVATDAARGRAAQVELRVLRFAAAYAIRADGTLAVEETITVDFGSNPRHGISRDLRLAARCAPRTPATGGGERRRPEGYERRWPVRDLRVHREAVRGGWYRHPPSQQKARWTPRESSSLRQVPPSGTRWGDGPVTGWLRCPSSWASA